MGEMKGNLRCTFWCWALAALAGALAGVMVHLLGGFSGPQSVFVAVLLTVVVGFFLSVMLCGRLPTLDEVRARTEAARAMTSGSAPAAAPAAAAPVAKASAAPVAAPVAAAPAAAPAAKPASTFTPTPSPAASSASASAAKPAAAPAPAAVMSQPTPASPAPDDAAIAAAGEGTKPKGLAAPRGGKADNLKTIEGIGPVLEKLCHEMGIFHFDQIAGWGASEVAWMNANLKGFKGRVGRDKWVAQARLIGEVGVEEFLVRAKTNDY